MRHLIGSFLLTLIANAALAASGVCPQWTYRNQAAWGESCTVQGYNHTSQSPININTTTQAKLQALQFSYNPFAMQVTNTGYGYQVNVPANANCTVTANGITYTLTQFHFHFPAEHTISGVRWQGEVHFVHSNPKASPSLLVVGVLIDVGLDNGSDNSALQPIIQLAGTAHTCPDTSPGSLQVNPMTLIPTFPGYYAYQGGLTTPLCNTSQVAWRVMVGKINASTSQISSLSLIQNNARDLQKSTTPQSWYPGFAPKAGKSRK